METIGFIGLGNMGGGMAANLVKAGYQVNAYDLSQDALKNAKSVGCHPCANLAEAIANADVLITMLPAGKHVETVYLGQGGIIANATKNTLLIDCSTIDIETARRVFNKALEKGLDMVDAPVSGGVSAAANGTLTFMVGGPDASFKRAQEVLKDMGKNIFHAGPSGNGQAAKMCNNMLLGISMIGTCEAFALADKLGLDAQTFFDISSTASGQNWSMTSYCPAPGPVPTAPSNRDYQAGFTAAMMLKDLRLAQQAASSARAATPLGAQAVALYALIEAKGRDDLDFSAIMKLIDGSL